MSKSSVFDAKAEEWNTTRELPWNRLRYELTHELLCRNLDRDPVSVLDIGCGNGTESYFWLAKAQHITLSDVSSKMLQHARDLIGSVDSPTVCEFVESDAAALAGTLEHKFGLIMLHNVLEYVDDPLWTLRHVRKLLSPGGIISVRFLNRYSNPFIPAMYQNDLDTALAHLRSPRMQTSFGPVIETFSREALRAILQRAGFDVQSDYGVLALTGYMTDNSKKSEEPFYQKLKDIELEMADRYPYRDIARFGLFLAR